MLRNLGLLGWVTLTATACGGGVGEDASLDTTSLQSNLCGTTINSAEFDRDGIGSCELQDGGAFNNPLAASVWMGPGEHNGAPIGVAVLIWNRLAEEIYVTNRSFETGNLLALTGPDGNRVWPFPSGNEPGPPPIVLACGRFVQLTEVEDIRPSCFTNINIPDLREIFPINQPGTYQLEVKASYATYPRVFVRRDGLRYARLDEFEGAGVLRSAALSFNVP